MNILIIGGTASGKSEYGEYCAEILSDKNKKKYYIATLFPYDEETRERINRHILQRRDKQFETIEKFTDFGKIEVEKNSTVLLECMGNLLSNEMYMKKTNTVVSQHIINDIKAVSKRCKNLIVISNNVSCDFIKYNEETESYIKNISNINSEISRFFEACFEVVCGIPICLKGEIL